MKAWHFVNDTLRDGLPVPADGEKLVHDGELAMCRTGLHGSVRLVDAVVYAPGPTLCRVEMGGTIIAPEDEDKLVASERTILWRIDSTPILDGWRRRVALDVAHLWDMPDIVRQYLETGDESLRDAAWATARVAAWDAAWDAAWTTARDAAKVAARVAAWGAARVAAWATARDAARVAAWATARDADRAAAFDKYNDWLVEMVEEARGEGK